MSQPGYPNAQPLSTLVPMLQSATRQPQHRFWQDDISMLDVQRFHHPHMHSARQLTDLYLLALAVRNEGRLASFAQRIPLSAVAGAEVRHMVTL